MFPRALLNIPPSVSDFVLSLFSSVLTGVLVPTLLALIQNRKGRPKFAASHWIAAVAVAAAMFGLLSYIFRPAPELGLTKIEERQPTILPDGKAQYDVYISGYVRNWKSNVYILVKPAGSADWYVQAAVDRLGAEKGGQIDWQGKATFYTAQPFPGEEFAFYALATKAEYKMGDRLTTQPEGYQSIESTVWGGTK